VPNYEREAPTERGTFTTSGGTIRFTPTHFRGDGILISLVDDEDDDSLEEFSTLINPFSWYTKSRLRNIVANNAGILNALGMSMLDIDALLDDFFASHNQSYSINNNILSFRGSEYTPLVFIRD
jgi:hypothetical protein